MAYGQIDPARLQGEALQRWYLRSPAEVEEERKSAADRAYTSFFSRGNAEPAADSTSRGDDDHSQDDTGLAWRPAGDNRWQSQRLSADQSSTSTPTNAGGYQLAATAGPRGFWDYWGVPGCANCHGYTPDTLPPFGGHSPFPPSYSPRSGNPGESSPQPRKEDHPQCEMQDRRDRGICTQQPTERTKAACHASATNRREWCDSHDGEIGTPDLFTARRKSGRPWP